MPKQKRKTNKSSKADGRERQLDLDLVSADSGQREEDGVSGLVGRERLKVGICCGIEKTEEGC
jgi:hypothetical protein